MSKTFTFSGDGIAYTVTVYEDEAGNIKADITVTEGSMDVNAIYWGDDDFSGDSVGLRGPLNMNGEGSQYEGERIQWDGAQEVSRPGLGREGEDKPSFLSEGQTLTLNLDDVGSLDEIDFIGIRATSVNGSGSIKGVSGDPEDEVPPPPPHDDPATYDKVFFVKEFGEDDNDDNGTPLVWDRLSEEELEAAGLDPDAEGTFENFLAVAGTNDRFDITDFEAILFYEELDGGGWEEIARLVPEGDTFADADEVVEAYTALTGRTIEWPPEPEQSGFDLDSMEEDDGDDYEDDYVLG
ncbi:MAG: hypothetical protein JJU42_05465 [Rhodobacteraceae bacterium]|nr:hypothetical protein [Paracoccaceae bacterium]